MRLGRPYMSSLVTFSALSTKKILVLRTSLRTSQAGYVIGSTDQIHRRRESESIPRNGSISLLIK